MAVPAHHLSRTASGFVFVKNGECGAREETAERARSPVSGLSTVRQANPTQEEKDEILKKVNRVSPKISALIIHNIIFTQRFF